MPNNVIRKAYPGAASSTTISGSITASSTTVDITATAGWPTGPTKWVVTINRGGATEEQILVSSRSGSTLSFDLANRGYAGTSAFSHSAGESIDCSVDPVTLDEANRVLALPTAAGQMLVFDGTNIQVLTAPGDDDFLVGDTGEANGMAWISRWIPVAASAPAIVAADGQSYYDTVRQELMVTVSGTFESAALGVVVFANEAARDSLFGSSGSEPAGRFAFLADAGRMTFGTGTGWRDLPVPGQFIVHFADATALQAETDLEPGDVAVTDDEYQIWLKRSSGTWYPIGVHFIGSDVPPVEDTADGDLWSQPL